MTQRYGDTLPVTLSAGVWHETGAIGKHFIVADAVGSFDYQIRHKHRTIGYGEGLKAGFGLYIPDGFESLLIRAAVAQTVLIVVSDDWIDYNRVTGNIQTTSAPLTPEHDGDTTIAASTAIVPPAGTVAIQLTGDPNNTDNLWPSGVVGKGTPIQPGATISWPVGSTINVVPGSGMQALYWTFFKE